MYVLRALLVWVVIGNIIALPCRAEDLRSGLSFSKDLQLGISARGSEFVSGDYPGALLMKVNLWGAVNKSGIHYVPTQTDLVTLLSFAGGPTDKASLDDISIKRYVGGKETILKVDGEKLLTSTGVENPQLEANDIVVIPTRKPIVSNDTALIITVVATVLTVVLGAVVVARNQ